MHRTTAVAAALLTFAVAPRAHGAEHDRSRAASVRHHLDFDHADIGDVAKVMSRWTGRNFILGDTVRGRITIVGPAEVTAAEAYDAFIGALDANGLAVARSGAFYRIVPKKDAPRYSIPLELSGG